MRYEMKMPDLATTECEIRIVRWLVERGEQVQRGQPLVEVETDKATMEVESVVSGVLQEVQSQASETVSVGQVIAVLEAEGATVKPPTGAGKPVGMFARNRAAAAEVPSAPAAGVPLSVAQRVAAKRLAESKQTIPHFYLQTSANAAAMVARRKAAEPAKLAWDAFLVSAVARAIGRFDRFRCRLDGDWLVPVHSDAIGVAVDDSNELFVIPVDSPAAKTVEQISDDIRRGAERVRSGDPEARRIRPALLTVTNLGVCRIESFIPIINPPEAAVLGVGRVTRVPVVQDDGQIGVQQRCSLTLSVDHRIVSGRYAGDFLAAIVTELELF